MITLSRSVLLIGMLTVAGCFDSNASPDGGANPDGGAGDCTSNGDCASGSCVELVPGGFSSCAENLESSECTGSGSDQCCDTGDCADGICAEMPGRVGCRGLMIGGFNACIVDDCVTDAECGMDNVCLPAGVLGRPVRQCIWSLCRTDSDCAEEADGRCVPVQTTCCDGPNVLACAYPSDGCRATEDCAPSGSCELMGSRAYCFDGPVACPL